MCSDGTDVLAWLSCRLCWGSSICFNVRIALFISDEFETTPASVRLVKKSSSKCPGYNLTL